MALLFTTDIKPESFLFITYVLLIAYEFIFCKNMKNMEKYKEINIKKGNSLVDFRNREKQLILMSFLCRNALDLNVLMMKNINKMV